MASEVAYSNEGIEVYGIPHSTQRGLPVHFHTTFDGKHHMWVWNRGTEEANSERLSSCERVLLDDGLSTSSYDIVRGWSQGYRPTFAETEVVLLRHVRKVSAVCSDPTVFPEANLFALVALSRCTNMSTSTTTPTSTSAQSSLRVLLRWFVIVTNLSR